MLENVRMILEYPHKITGIRYALRNPSLLFVCSKNLSKFYLSKASGKILGSNFILNLHNSLPEKFLKHLKEKNFDPDGISLMLYSIVRAFKPDAIVETGVARGASSAFILCALHENKRGHLYSIDLPLHETSYKIINMNGIRRCELKDGQKYSVRPDALKIGDLIPEYVKRRWTLILGDSKKELPELLERIRGIDIFFHDSLHTYEHMLFEYETAWRYVRKDGLLISHDVLWNMAFLDFSKKYGRTFTLCYSLGVIKK